MIDNYITVILQGFPAQYPVLITKNGETNGSGACLDDIARAVCNSAQANKINQIKIFGNAEFAKPIVEEIKDYSATEYAINDLEIEVISK